MQVISHSFSNARSEWNQTILAELRIAHNEQLTLPINVGSEQSTNLTNTKPEGIQHAENQMIGEAAVGSSRSGLKL
ncbi:MAG: hypothetical protein SGJ27_01805 [Candidatus Melainabacteria bacterium]|nr:hypothetical protein [Candidatus Melainabacteria bacterium]